MALKCLRCDHELESYGERGFQKTNRRRWLEAFGTPFVPEFRVEVYGCSACGHIEFFNPAVGAERRRKA